MRGLGNDIIEISRVATAISRHGTRFLDELFTPLEQAYCLRYQKAERHFAGRFAAKEAILKALGVGLSGGIRWIDLEISNDPQGKPLVSLSSALDQRFNSPQFLLTISHCKEYASAVAILL